MQLSMDQEKLLNYLINQIWVFFPDNNKNIEELKKNWNLILQRVEYCFDALDSEYCYHQKEMIFNHLNGDHYSMLLYFAANTLYRQNSDLSICAKLFHLNRYLHGIDAFYEVELPDFFLFVHPLGTVLGRAQYSNYFIVYQNCTVGGSTDANGKIIYPVIKEHVTMYSGSSILGNCRVGNNSIISARSLLINKNLDNEKVFFGSPMEYKIASKKIKQFEWKA